MIISICNFIGAASIKLCHSIGSTALITTRLVPNRIYYLKSTIAHFINFFFNSILVITLTAIFTGAVLTLQSYTGFSRFNFESSISALVVISITRELAPVLVGLIMSGKLSSAIAAEIGTMKISEQIDAMKLMKIDPMKCIAAPMIFAGIISLPLLTIIADIIGIYSGYLVGVHKLHFNPDLYISNTLKYLEYSDVILGIKKSLAFGITITAVGCYKGYNAHSGAKGVGKATQESVMISSILILMSNYIITWVNF